MSTDHSHRTIRTFQPADAAAVVAVWHRAGIAAYTFLPTWQAFTLEQARGVFDRIIRPNCAIWVATLDERVVAYLGTIDALRQRCDSLSTLGIGSVAESQGAAPPRQLELTPPGAAEFVICDHTIETFFADQKSRGFHLHKSHIADPQRLSRLCIAACLAYIWIVY
jgi:hypothetical protein